MIYITDDKNLLYELSNSVHKEVSSVEACLLIQENWNNKHFNVTDWDNIFGITDSINNIRYFGDSGNFIRVTEVLRVSSPELIRATNLYDKIVVLVCQCSETGRRVLSWTRVEVK